MKKQPNTLNNEIINSGTEHFPFYQVIINGKEYCATDDIEKAENLLSILSQGSDSVMYRFKYGIEIGDGDMQNIMNFMEVVSTPPEAQPVSVSEELIGNGYQKIEDERERLQFLKDLDKLINIPMVTSRFGDNWKEHAKKHYDFDAVIDIAWKQGRKAILLARKLSTPQHTKIDEGDLKLAAYKIFMKALPAGRFTNINAEGYADEMVEDIAKLLNQ
jgi:hypothetical protein